MKMIDHNHFICHLILGTFTEYPFLKDNRHWEYEKLKEASGLSDRDLNAAIGWLAREDKIDFDMTEEGDRIFLTVNVFIG